MPLSAQQYARIIAPLGEQTTRQSGVRTRVLSIISPTAAGSVTYKNIGFTPKGLICLGLAGALSPSPTVPGANYYASLGAADGTTQWFSGSINADGLATAAPYISQKTDCCIAWTLTGGAGMGSRAALTSFSSANGGSFTLNWLNVVASAAKFSVLVLGGDDVAFACGLVNTGTVTGSLVVTSSLAFTPTLVGMLSSNIAAVANTGNTGAVGSQTNTIGWATATDAVCAATFSLTGAADSTSYRRLSAGVLFALLSSGVEGLRCSLTSLNSNGFTINRDVNTGINNNVGWVALAVPTPKVGTFECPATPGTQTLALPGVVPRGAVLFGTNTATLDTIETEAHLTIGVTDGTTRASWSGHNEHGRPTIRAKHRGDLGYLYRPQISYGDNLYHTGPTIKTARFAPEAIDLTWERINTPSVRVLQNVSGSASSVTIAATTAGSTLIVAISHTSGTVSAPWAPNDATNGAYTVAHQFGTTSASARVFYVHNSAAGVTSVNLGYSGAPTFVTRVIEVVGLANEAPTTDSNSSTPSGFTHLLATKFNLGADPREGYFVAPAAGNGTLATPVVPGFSSSVASASLHVYGPVLDGVPPSVFPEPFAQLGIATTSRSIAWTVSALFRAPASTPQKIGYVVFGELTGPPAINVNVHETIAVTEASTSILPELVVRVSDTVTVTDHPQTGYPPAYSDVLQRRSMTAVGLFHLRGGVVPTGAHLETKRERRYAEGLYARYIPTTPATPLDIPVSDAITITEAVTAALTGGPLTLAIFDTVAVSESAKAAIQLGVVLAEAVAVTDAGTAAVQLGLVRSDAVTLTDAVQVALSPTLRSAFDAVTVTDAAMVALQLGVVCAETITVSELAKAAVTPLGRSVFDAITVSESGKAAIQLGVVLHDSLTITEATKPVVSPVTVVVVETITVSEHAAHGTALADIRTYVNLGGTWKVATWYVNVGGVWQPGAVRVKAGGAWES